MISGITEPDFIHLVLESGADGYIPKALNGDILLNAIRLILSGEIYVPSLYLKYSSGVHADNTPTTDTYADLSDTFTPRQLEVMQLVSDGLSNKEIAHQLNCSENTVKTHISAILHGLNVTSRAKVNAAIMKLRGDVMRQQTRKGHGPL